MLNIGGERGSLVLVNGLRAQKRVIPGKHQRYFKYYFEGMSLRQTPRITYQTDRKRKELS